MASHVKLGRGEPGERFQRAADQAELIAEKANTGAAEILQREVVARVPRRTGKLAEVFASPDAIQPSRIGGGKVVYGLVTPALWKRGYYARFVEYGTKGYRKGGFREEIDKKTGKLKRRKIRRDIPARRAQPFFRPGVDAAKPQIRTLHKRILDAIVRAAE